MFTLMRILIIVLAMGVTVVAVVLLSDFLGKVKKDAEEESKKREAGTSAKDWVLNKIRREPKNIISRLIKVGVGGLGGLIAFLVVGQLYWGVVIGIFSSFIPIIVATKSHTNYMTRFDAQLIDGLNLITNAMRAGASFPQALELMVTEGKPPLSEVFGETLREFKLGVPMGEALENTISRVESDDLIMAVIAINIARETGGNLGDILANITATMRERRNLKGKVVALTAQGKAGGMVVAGMPFLLLIVMNLLEREMMEPFLNSLFGNVVMTVVMVMVAMGWFIISKIIDIKV